MEHKLNSSESSKVLDDSNEDTICLDNKSITQFRNTKQEMYQGKVDSKTMSKKKNRFIVIFFVLLIIICGIVFLSGSKETTSSANTNMEISTYDE